MEPINLGRRSFNDKTAAAIGPQEGVTEAFHKDEETLLDVCDLSMPVAEEKPSNFCDVCHKEFRDKQGVQKHRRIHFEGEFPCRKCGKKIQNSLE